MKTLEPKINKNCQCLWGGVYLKTEPRECSYQIRRRPRAGMANPQSSCTSEKFPVAKAEMPTEIPIRVLIRACANPISFPFIKSHNPQQGGSWTLLCSLQNFTYAGTIYHLKEKFNYFLNILLVSNYFHLLFFVQIFWTLVTVWMSQSPRKINYQISNHFLIFKPMSFVLWLFKSQTVVISSPHYISNN